MKGFAILRPNEVGWIEKDRPLCGITDAIVSPLAISPCTSDVHTVWEGTIGERRNLILGHEAVGTVIEVGSLVKDFKPGDKVIIPAITPDWTAVESQMGFAQHSGGLFSGWKLSNSKDGVFGEFFHVNDADGNMALLPEGVSVEDAVMLSDMVPTGLHGADLAEVAFGETVVVIGIGPVGLMAVAGANLRGAARIIAVDSRPVCADVAKEYGATDIVDYKSGDTLAQIMELTNRKSVDKVIIAGGGVAPFEQAVRMVRPGGIVANLNSLGSADHVKIPRVGWGLGMGHIRIIGGMTPGGRKNTEYLSNLLKYKKLDTSPLLTHRFSGFEHIGEALLLMKDKPLDLIKPVVTI